MAEIIEVHEPGDKIYTMAHGKVIEWVVNDLGEVEQLYGDQG